MAIQDGFYDPAHQVIYNRLGITNQDQLREAEGALSIPALLRIVVGAVDLPGQFDAAHLKRIHRELFQDVYAWAGQTRAHGPNGPFQGQKPAYVLNPRGDTMRYAPYQQLDQRLDAIGAQLQLENNLRGLAPEQFARRAAYYFDQYNHAHAFREGNGRTIQSVMTLLGRQAGYQVELSPAAAAQLNNARDLAIIRPYGPAQPDKNLEPLVLLLRTAVTPLAGAEAMQLRDASQARPLAAPTPDMQRMEAQRVMQTSAYIIGEALRDIDLGDTTRGNQLLQQMTLVLHEPIRVEERSASLQQAALEVSKHSILCQEPPLMQQAVALAQSVQQLVQLERLAQKKMQSQSFDDTVVTLKRRGPRL
ncbi:Fic/DOC family protein [Hymenobacter weizhouensis]|uniref:Fic/DOC family protein n=1 Tax=Hymenobacter sp. YIM 151500-1 TaxID=2987689 RepID=UPI002226DB51|nr:Fic family protein [Hymenobacter sp. YIM 151500-1]UYZ65291.1 Fic family protein [Hymenobacter sp. YIM 151500-1]